MDRGTWRATVPGVTKRWTRLSDQHCTTVLVDLQCVLVSGVQQRDSVMYMFFFVFFSIMVYYKILNIGPRVIQQDLIVYLFYIYC